MAALLAACAVPQTAVTPTSHASASASIFDDRFGLIVTSGGRGSETVATVRSETSDRVITTFASQGRSWTDLSQTVSPDGRSIAYWAPVNDGPALHVLPAAGGADRVVFTGARGMYGNAFAWSSDSTGLVVAVDNNCQEICPSPQVKELWTVDLSSGAAERVASGNFWIPVTWDRTAKVIAAGVTGPGGYLTGYHVIDLAHRPTVLRGVGFDPTVIGRLKASSDGRFVLLSVDSGSSSTLSWWPLAEPEKRKEIPFDGATAEWRPGTSEIWWVGGLTPAACRVPPCGGTELESFDVIASVAKKMHGSFGGSLVGFRVDGTAAMTWQRGATESLSVVDVRSGQSGMLPMGRQFVRLR